MRSKQQTRTKNINEYKRVQYSHVLPKWTSNILLEFKYVVTTAILNMERG